jgi:hypothetical protein
MGLSCAPDIASSSPLIAFADHPYTFFVSLSSEVLGRLALFGILFV